MYGEDGKEDGLLDDKHKVSDEEDVEELAAKGEHEGGESEFEGGDKEG